MDLKEIYAINEENEEKIKTIDLKIYIRCIRTVRRVDYNTDQ